VLPSTYCDKSHNPGYSNAVRGPVATEQRAYGNTLMEARSSVSGGSTDANQTLRIVGAGS